MPEFLSKLPDWFKLPLRIYVVLFAVSFAILVVPRSMIDFLGMTMFVTTYRGIVGGICLLAFAFSLSVIGEKAFLQWRQRQTYLKAKHRRLERLQRLSPLEKEVLAPYLINRERTWYHDMEDGAVILLLREGILSGPSTFRLGLSAPISMQPWAWDYLNEHPVLVLDTTELDQYPHQASEIA